MKKVSKQREELFNFLVSKGWVEDKYGNLKRTFTDKEGKSELRRYKFNDISFRYEFQYVNSYGEKSWLKIRGAYYKDVSIVDDKIKLAKTIK